MARTKDFILKAFQREPRWGTGELAARLKITRQAVHRHLVELVREGKILRQGSSRRTTSYLLNDAAVRRKFFGKRMRFAKRVRAQGLEEDRLLAEVQAQPGLLDVLSSNARANFDYAFTEMVNNAIDHSGSALIRVEVVIDRNVGMFSVADTGIGIFENIRGKYGLADEMEAIQDLLKGKQTTLPERHSGEGIFFTSKIADRFSIASHRKRLVVDNRLDDIFIEDVRFAKGTRVIFEQGSDSTRRLDDLFRQYTNEHFAFAKSRVTVELFTGGESYVSRSQAKRLLHAFERFEEVVLDFKGVGTIGQAFADEIFRVFCKLHPDTKIISINCNENVDFMIKRASAGSLENG